MIDKTGLVILTTLAPISELRGGIPLGLYFGLDPVFTFILAVSFNSLIFFPVYFGMRFLYRKIFSRIWLFNVYLERLRQRANPYVEKYGLWVILLFVSLPLPTTGAYTGTFLAWLLDLDWKKAFLVVSLGVFIAGLIVSGISLGFFNFLKF